MCKFGNLRQNNNAYANTETNINTNYYYPTGQNCCTFRAIKIGLNHFIGDHYGVEILVIAFMCKPLAKIGIITIFLEVCVKISFKMFVEDFT